MEIEIWKLIPRDSKIPRNRSSKSANLDRRVVQTHEHMVESKIHRYLMLKGLCYNIGTGNVHD